MDEEKSEEQSLPIVGGYYMQRGFLVRIESEKNGNFGTQYVQIASNGEVMSGGFSFSWPASDYTPITDPRLYAAAQVFEARRQARDHTVEASRLEGRAATWMNAMEAITKAAEAVA